MFGNASVEDAPGVEAAYASIGRTNIKPFIYGEVGAIANHGQTGERWQAEAVAKMIAWVCSRDSYLGISFCVAHENNIDKGRQWGYTMGRRPGEAAMATASALIDGLAYTAVGSNDSDVDLAKFGNTYMAWKRTDGSKSWTIHLPSSGPWDIVDVVGKKTSLAVDENNNATIQITPSPVYLLTQMDYYQLTGIDEAPAPDITAPTLTAGTVNRISDTAATVKFTSSETGLYYYKIVSDGDTLPIIDTEVAGTVCTTKEITITNPIGLTAGAKDIYIVVKDAAGNVSSPLKIDIGSMPPPTSSSENQATPVITDYTVSGNNITLIPNTSAGGIAHMDLSKVDFDDVFKNISNDKDGKQKIFFDFNKIEGKQVYELQLPIAVLQEFSERVYEIVTPVCTLRITGNMFSKLEAQGNVTLSIGSVDKTKLGRDLQNIIGDKPVIELNAYVDGKPYKWSSTDAPVTAYIPYTADSQELKNLEHLTVLYIDGRGTTHPVFSGSYDLTSNKIVFKTDHFSQYAVVYADKSFNDIAKYAWARDSIEIMASKGILDGVSTDLYAPAEHTSRADFLLYLCRTLGLDAEFDYNFDDVKPESYYYNAVGVAKKLGITAGVGDNQYMPDAEISRQDMMTLIVKALKVIERVKETTDSSVLEGYSDRSSIASYAVDNIALLVKEGIIVGNGNKIFPRNNATRAETAVIMYKLYNKYK